MCLLFIHPRAKWSVSAFFAKGYVHITNSKQRKHLSPSARCTPVNGLAGCYVSTIGKPHEYFDLTGTTARMAFVQMFFM